MPPALSDREAIAKELVSLCEQQLKSEKSRPRQARLCYEVGRLCESSLHDLDSAHRYYQKAHGLEPASEATLAGLVRVRSSLGQWEGTLKPLEEMSELAGRVEDKAAMLFVKALIQEVRLERLSDARADFDRAARLCKNDASLAQAVERHARREQDYKALDAALSGRAQLCGSDVGLAAALGAERARVAEHLRKQAKEAAQMYELSFSTDPLASSAAYSLEHLLFFDKEYGAQAQLLRKRAELLSDAAARASSLGAAAMLLAESQNDFAAGAELLEAAWQAEPEDLTPLRSLADIYERGGDFSGMVSALARLEQRITDPQESAALCVLIGETMTRRLHKQDDAIPYFQKARQASPGNAACVAALSAFYEAKEMWGELVDVLAEEESTSNSPTRRAQLEARMARICEVQMGSSEQAILHYRAALGLVPGDESSFRELVRLLETARRYDEVVELHERAADAAPNEETRFAHLFKIGQIFEDLLVVPERAVGVYRRILQQRPNHLGAFFALQRAAGRAGDFETLVEALAGEAAVHTRPEDKLALLHRAAEVTLERLSKTTEALDLFGQVLAIDKHYAPTLASLVGFYEKEGRYSELLRVMTLQLNGTETPREKSEMLERMGRIAEESLGNDEKALSYYQRAHQIVPEAALPAQAVRRCLSRMGKLEELAGFLSESLKHWEAGPERARLFVTLGQLYEMRLAKLPLALSAYEKALEDQPGLAAAADGLIRVLEQRGDPMKTAQALSDRANATRDPAVRTWAALRRGELFETFDRSGARAIETYEAVLSENPGHPAALQALERLYFAKGDWAELGRILRVSQEAYGEKANKTAVLRQRLVLLEQKDAAPKTPGESSPPEPQDAVQELLRLEPGDRVALRHAESSAALSRQVEELASVAERYASVLDEGPLRSAYRTLLAEYLEPRNPAQALEHHRPALAEDRENIGAARGVSRIAEVVEDPELLIEAAQNESEVVQSKTRSAKLYVRAAELLKAAGDIERAVALLRRALSECPESMDAASAIFDLLSSRGQFDDLLSVLTEAAQHCSRADWAAEHWVAVAKIYADEKDDLPAAISALGRLEKAGRASLTALLELAEFYIRDRQWSQAVDVLRKCASSKPEPSALVAIRLRLAEVLHEEMQKTTDATRELREVLQVEPEHVGALRRLLAIQMKEGAAAALETAEKLVGVSDGPDRAEALIAQGKLLDKGKKPIEALTAFSGAVALIGMDPDTAVRGARKILGAPRTKPESWAMYESALVEFLKSSQPGKHQARMYLELADVVTRRDENQAVALLVRALADNPDSHEIRKMLVEKFVKTGRYREALPEVTAILRIAPFDTKAWSDLVEIYDALGRNAEAHLATGPLVLLGRGTELQQSGWRSRQAQPALLGPNAFHSQILAETLRQPVSPEALQLLDSLSSTISKVFPPQLEVLGTSTRNRIGPRGAHPVRNVLDRVCYCLGSPDVDLYFSDSAVRVHVLLTDPVGIVVPVHFSGLPESEQVFYLAGYVANAARNVAAVDALDLDQLRLLFAASRRLVDPSAEIQAVDPEELSQVTRRLQKSLPWLSKGRIEEAARRYADLPLRDVAEFARTLQESSRRAALLLGDDLRPVFQIREGHGRLLGLEGEQAEAAVADLLPYWASEEAVEIRRAIGALG